MWSLPSDPTNDTHNRLGDGDNFADRVARILGSIRASLRDECQEVRDATDA